MIKQKSPKNNESFESAVMAVNDMSKAKKVRDIIQGIEDIEYWAEFDRQRRQYSDPKGGAHRRKIASIPQEIYEQAQKIFGDNFATDKKLFKKFLDTEIYKGVKGEACLTVPREKL